MISVVTFKWEPSPGYRSHFTSGHVNILRRMVGRHYAQPHRFICVTDNPSGLDSGVEIAPLWNDHAALPSPHGGRNPSCYRRLKLYARDAAATFGPRLAILDLDTVITGDLSPIFDCAEDYRIYGQTNPNNPFNGSLTVMNAGARPQVWEKFDPRTSPALAKAKGFFGSDQAWLCAVLGPNEARFGKQDGVYSYRCDLKPNSGRLPPDARLVSFHGGVDPWSPEAQRLDWVRAHYR